MRLSRELKRRKVLHTVSLYIVGCWVALQVVEVLSEAGLPPNTMRYLLIAMSAGFPFVVVVAWFFDVSREGVTRTPPARDGEDLPAPNLGDHALLLGILAVVALNAYLLSTPPPDTAPAQVPEQRTLVVMAFDDIGTGEGDEPVGGAIAGELREELTRIAGLKVLGPETSRVIQSAGDSREAIAAELGVTALVTGEVRLHAGKLELHTRLVGLPAGNTVWQADHESGVHEGAGLQRRIAQAIVDVILPSASASTTHSSRVEEDECNKGYDLYLRGKQLRFSRNWERGLELLQEAVQLAPECAVAWEALAVASIVTWSKADFAKAGAAARRALELNDSLPGAWAVLAEVAEEEKRWDESEELFLHALYVAPTDAYTNMAYGEALLARGRVRDALHYSLQGYRYEPASASANYKVMLAARYAGDAELLIKHAYIYRDLRTGSWYDGWEELGEGYLMLGDVDRALEIWGEHPELLADWHPQCVRAKLDPAQADGLAAKMGETVRQYLDGDLAGRQEIQIWHVFRCATWTGKPEIVIDLLESERGIPTEQQFLPFFQYDSGILRQTEFFRNMVVESGLLDYWRKWGWSDYCRPDGDSFVCD